MRHRWRFSTDTPGHVKVTQCYCKTSLRRQQLSGVVRSASSQVEQPAQNTVEPNYLRLSGFSIVLFWKLAFAKQNKITFLNSSLYSFIILIVITFLITFCLVLLSFYILNHFIL